MSSLSKWHWRQTCWLPRAIHKAIIRTAKHPMPRFLLSRHFQNSPTWSCNLRMESNWSRYIHNFTGAISIDFYRMVGITCISPPSLSLSFHVTRPVSSTSALEKSLTLPASAVLEHPGLTSTQFVHLTHHSAAELWHIMAHPKMIEASWRWSSESQASINLSPELAAGLFYWKTYSWIMYDVGYN